MPTAVRITDSITVVPWIKTVKMPDGAEAEVTLYPNAKFHLLIFAHGEPRKFTVSVRGVWPNGESRNVHDFECETNGTVGGNAALVLNMMLPGEIHGVFWFEIYVDSELSLRLPIQILDGSGPSRAPESSQPSPSPASSDQES